MSQGENSAGFTAKLTSLMSSGFSKRANTKVRIETNAVKTYTLDNSEAWFREATNFDDTRRWIERSLSGDGIYLVIGFHTVTGARIVHESVEGHQLAGEATLPVGLSLAAVGAIAPLGGIFDPTVAGHQKVLDGSKTQFVAPGEQICVLQYCKISCRWLHSKNIDNLKLSEVPRWTAKESWRKASVDETKDEPDILEVETEELEQLEGDWEKAEEENGGQVLLMQCVEEGDDF
ncbi:uncharacterized protein N0V89_008916 [Didymosphaeria variabile]|uniref:Uncharacterized protein n=1 Tax=Didymosphaeria variabile TaxID=1932322 RepID=A0A9W8XGU9_9PLEO|nr:uncharacterized protein N0V89_008916 [Didymosphaeria variabile]KAJ4350295.1 hypothetical protein N0V89_008916 [Didymosphaeria variabile]